MRIKILILLLIFVSGINYATGPTEDQGTNIILKPKNPRPHDAGEENAVWYTYANGIITINFEQPEGRATMTIARMEDASISSVSFYTMAPYSYNIGSVPGTYIIVIKTSHQEYEALLAIE